MLEILDTDAVSHMPGYDNHEKVVHFTDKKTGLDGYVAIHNTAAGPAIGGTRMHNFETKEEALEDVLKLSRAMTSKCALAGLPYGGGKCVIIGTRYQKTPELLRAYGRVIEELGGQIRTGVDVGIDDSDVEIMSEETDYMVGTAKHGVKLSTGDMAALGVYYSALACFNKVLKNSNVKDRKVVIQGAGKLGGELARLLYKDGAKISLADVDQAAVDRLMSECPGVEQVDVDQASQTECDLYAPCSLGGEVNSHTIDGIKARIICGGANNQLESSSMAQILHEKGVLYAPDYVVNSGGLINVADELEQDGYNKDRVLQRVKSIGQTLDNILEQAMAENISPSLVADRMANQIIQKHLLTRIQNG